MTYVQALANTQIHDETMTLQEVEKGQIVKTCLYLYKQYMSMQLMNPGIIKCLSHKYDEYGTTPIYIVQTLDDVRLHYNFEVVDFKKGDHLFLTETEADLYVQQGLVQIIYHEDLVEGDNKLEEIPAEETTTDEVPEDAESEKPVEETTDEKSTDEIPVSDETSAETPVDETTETVEETPTETVEQPTPKKKKK